MKRQYPKHCPGCGSSRVYIRAEDGALCCRRCSYVNVPKAMEGYGG
jgi:ribosomal protein L37AE/L43A